MSAPISGASMTDLRFSAPTFSSSIRVLVRRIDLDDTFAHMLKTLWAYAHMFDWMLLASILGISMLAAQMIWLLESLNPRSCLAKRSYFRGFMEVFWLCAAFGFAGSDGRWESGSRSPLRLGCYLARAVALVWLVSSIVMMVMFVSHFTVHLLNQSSDDMTPISSSAGVPTSFASWLLGARVGVLAGEETLIPVKKFFHVRMKMHLRFANVEMFVEPFTVIESVWHVENFVSCSNRFCSRPGTCLRISPADKWVARRTSGHLLSCIPIPSLRQPYQTCTMDW